MSEYSENRLLFETHFVKIKGYVNDKTKLKEVSTKSILNSPQIDEKSLPKHMIEGEDIIVIEDIYDTGTLMSLLIEHISNCNPKSFEVAMLMHKKNRNNIEHKFTAKYTGFIIPNDFIIGYGMDYAEKFREMPHVCIINEKGRETFREEE